MPSPALSEAAARRPVRGAPGELVRLVPARRGFRWTSLPRPLRISLPLGTLVALWWVSSASGLLPERTLPGPPAMVRTAVDLIADGTLGGSIAVSAQRALTGLAAGTVIGVPLALIAGLTVSGRAVVDSTMQVVRTLPWAGMMPVFVIWFGIGEQSKINLIILATAFPIYVNAFSGIRATPAPLLEAGRTLGYSPGQLLAHVVAPHALPYFFTGLRYALGTAWVALVFAEQINATSGLGYLISNARTVFRVDIIIVCLVVYAILGLLCDAVVRLMERSTLRWQHTLGT